MKGITRLFLVSLLAGGTVLLTASCDQEDNGGSDTAVDTTTDTPADTSGDTVTDTPADTTADTEPDSTCSATISGTVGRTIGTCPPGIDGVGTLCLSLRTDCTDGSTEVASTTVASANMSYPTNTVPFSITDVPNGSYQLYGLLDDDMSGCDDVTTGDFYSSTCLSVTVAACEDVTGLVLTFTSKCP